MQDFCFCSVVLVLFTQIKGVNFIFKHQNGEIISRTASQIPTFLRLVSLLQIFSLFYLLFLFLYLTNRFKISLKSTRTDRKQEEWGKKMKDTSWDVWWCLTLTAAVRSAAHQTSVESPWCYMTVWQFVMCLWRHSHWGRLANELWASVRLTTTCSTSVFVDILEHKMLFVLLFWFLRCCRR